MNETWKQIPGYHYSVSSIGRVRNDLTDKIKAPRVDKYGYARVDIYKDGKPYREKIHRLVSNAFIPNPEHKPQVNHINGNKLDNSIGNLEWTTASENMQHCVKTGLFTPSRGMPGKKNPNAGRPGKPIRIKETGEVFNSITECAKAIGGNDTGILDNIAGGRKSHRGFTFEYIP